VSHDSGPYGNAPLPDAPVDPPSTRRRVRRPVIIGVVTGVAVGAAVASTIVVAAPSFVGSVCAPGPELRVVTAPELRTVVAGAVDVLKNREEQDCALAITITSENPAVTAANLEAERGHRPDVWIPDSSVWTLRATKPGTGFPDSNPSLAKTPVVLAVSNAGSTRTTTVENLVPAAGKEGAHRWVLPEPEDAAATVGALIELQDAVAASPDGPARFGSVVRSSNRNPINLADLPRRTALPTTEQQAYSHNVAHPADRITVAYATKGFQFDYPMVALTNERERRDRATSILQVLQSDLGQQLLANAGFRSTEGTAGAALIEEFGTAARASSLARLADEPAVNSAIRAYTSIVRPTRLLAAIDVSGSMAHEVPGARGATRLDLAIQASVNGLAVYPDETVVGVWEFATNLTPTTDYKVIAPLQELGRGDDGETGRQRIAQALSQVQTTKARTGLNDTTLAAVREVRRHWDPKRVNSVVIITDGGNSDKAGISTKDLLRTLAAENDPERPVAVFAIAYGPSGDVASLQRISAVTGGRAYAAPDPRQINAVLADAIGRRSCSPDC